MIEFLSDPPMQWVSVGLTVGAGLALFYLIANKRYLAAVPTGGATAGIAAATYDLFQWDNSNNAFTFFGSPTTAFIGLLIDGALLLGVTIYLITQRLLVPAFSMWTLTTATGLVSLGHGRAADPANQLWGTATLCAVILTTTLAAITLLEARRARRYRKAQANAA